jgi:hypothetical protein
MDQQQPIGLWPCMFERVMKLQALIRVRNKQIEASIQPQTGPPRTRLHGQLEVFPFLFIFLLHFLFFAPFFFFGRGLKLVSALTLFFYSFNSLFYFFLLIFIYLFSSNSLSIFIHLFSFLFLSFFVFSF